MVASIRNRGARAVTFAQAAGNYWLSVFPHVRREICHWRERASQIPDPVLRGLALATQRIERGNLEGAAAFAILVPGVHRACVVRALVAYQVAYDYLDTLAEQSRVDPKRSAHQLHLALLTALDPGLGHPDYYAFFPRRWDAGYVRDLCDTCRHALSALPSYGSVATPALRSARRMIAYQSLNHEDPGYSNDPLARWATAQTPLGAGLRWWETAAGAASSLTVFALIAAAAQPAVCTADAIATENVYFPWIGALHVLLDSLIDQPEDANVGRHSLVDHYGSSAETACRLRVIAAHALESTKTLPNSMQHATILGAMTSFYLSAPEATRPAARLATQEVLHMMGDLATPAMLVHRARRSLNARHREHRL